MAQQEQNTEWTQKISFFIFILHIIYVSKNCLHILARKTNESDLPNHIHRHALLVSTNGEREIHVRSLVTSRNGELSICKVKTSHAF